MITRNILIIEDDTGIQAVTKFSLEMDGHWQVSIANCGKEGLLKAKIINPEVILLDAIALNTREVEILSQLRLDKTTRNIPIILFTTKIIDLKHLARQNRSIIGTIYKPFDALTLSKKICDILNRKAQLVGGCSSTNH